MPRDCRTAPPPPASRLRAGPAPRPRRSCRPRRRYPRGCATGRGRAPASRRIRRRPARPRRRCVTNISGACVWRRRAGKSTRPNSSRQALSASCRLGLTITLRNSWMRARESAKKIRSGYCGASSAISSRTAGVTTPPWLVSAWSAIRITSNDSTASLQAVENLAFHLRRQRRGVDEIQARLVFDAGARVDDLGVGEGLHGRACARSRSVEMPRASRARDKLHAEAIVADRAQHRDAARAQRGQIVGDGAARARRDFGAHHADARDAGFARGLGRRRDRRYTSGPGRCRPPPARRASGIARGSPRSSCLFQNRAAQRRKRGAMVAAEIETLAAIGHGAHQDAFCAAGNNSRDRSWAARDGYRRRWAPGRTPPW